MAQHNDIGAWGEEMARQHLISKGYGIVDTNSRIGPEVDIIATKDDRIVFVEVKTRSSDFGDPLATVDRKKMSRLATAANAFIRRYGVKFYPQFDVITVIGEPEMYEITHYEDAFRPPLRTR
ncbi:MAG: YraN family protein [Bacteroidales bacterium]|nr:YraN family protein [Bacteroidales bacterium]MCD8394228.1 YraN family protein [Bacteroidales bacterium]